MDFNIVQDRVPGSRKKNNKKKVIIYLYPLMLFQTLVTLLHGTENECGMSFFPNAILIGSE